MPNRIEKNWEVKGIDPSYAERRIIHRLKSEKFNFKREVCFASCRSSATGNHLRYDFFLPGMNILLEYDGKAYHEGEHVAERDAVKTKYARDFNIKLIRISGLSNIDVAINRLCEIRDKRSARKRAKHKATIVNQSVAKPVSENKPKTQSEIRDIISRRHLFAIADTEPCKGIALPTKKKKLPDPRKLIKDRKAV